MKWSPRKFSGTKRRACEEEEGSDCDIPKSPSSLAFVPFAGILNSPTIPLYLKQIDNQEDEFIEVGVPKAQNMDQSLSQFLDIITIVANMSRGNMIFPLHPTFPAPSLCGMLLSRTCESVN